MKLTFKQKTYFDYYDIDWAFSDVGMMMMQSGMVKQSVDYTSSIKALDGTIIEPGFNP